MSELVTTPFGTEKIQTLIRHRYPFLLVDRITEYEIGKRIVGYKNVSSNEPFFQGHFPGHPIMPGVLIVEAMAQTGGVLMQLGYEGNCLERMFYLVKIENARFNKMVVPGDRLDMEVKIKRLIRNMGVYVGEARVNGELAASAEFLCAEATD